MFIYLEKEQVLCAIDKVIKIYIKDDLTTVSVVIEGNYGFDLFHDTPEEAKERLDYLASHLDINNTWSYENEY